MKNRNHKELLFRRLGLTTVIAVYILILVGGIVRSTGSGMGCPDWPRCFGNWIPPVSESELPENYKDIYVGKRISKNSKLAGYLEHMGYQELAQKIKNDPSIEEEQPFNATKTWIEYINRLIGVLIGLLIMGTLVTSIPYLKTDKRIFYLALASFFLVVFQGWLGSVVVSTNLLPGMVTVHMLLALVIVVLLINAVYISNAFSDTKESLPESMKWFLGFAILMSLIQVILGTQVREALDVVSASMQYIGRDSWIGQTGIVFPLHRSYSILIVAVNGYILFRLWKYRDNSMVWIFGTMLAAIILLSVVSGMIMAYLGIPAFAQPIHLLLGTLLVGIQYVLFLNSKAKTA